MKFARRILLAGGIFNTVMAIFFVNVRTLELFFRMALWLENTIFHEAVSLAMPENPVHLLLIHGFGAAALILGATLICSARDPHRYLPFILIDAIGRLLYGSLMLIYVVRFSLMHIILVFGVIELLFGLSYLYLSWKIAER